jgi:hypothetical protein
LRFSASLWVFDTMRWHSAAFTRYSRSCRSTRSLLKQNLRRTLPFRQQSSGPGIATNIFNHNFETFWSRFRTRRICRPRFFCLSGYLTRVKAHRGVTRHVNTGYEIVAAANADDVIAILEERTTFEEARQAIGGTFGRRRHVTDPA